MTPPHLWLRAETHPGEQRSPLTPADTATLIEQGTQVTVEHSFRTLPSDRRLP